MSQSPEKKVRILWILRFLARETDKDHGLTEKELEERLNEQGIPCERRLIYDDLHALEFFGYEIGKYGRPVRYYLDSRMFSLPELKLLVDAVQSSRFLTTEKSDELIHKLEGLCSYAEARELSRSVHVQNRIKAMNESIYLNVDRIHTGISLGRQIRFQYFRWNARKEKEFRHGGGYYTVSPYALTWTDDNYYMIAWDADNGQIRHYRVDRMIRITVSDLPREGQKEYDRVDLARYTNKHFGMFGGEECAVRLLCDDSLAGIIIDRFGTEPSFFRASDTTFEVTVKVVPSPQFFGWLAGLEGKIRITSPKSVVDSFTAYLDGIRRAYED
ncbi:MAG: helix-turn-helix transcriptional regulator [Eubacteriales bacterium]